MNRDGLFRWAEEEFGARPEYLWLKFPEYAVLRNAETGKWFAVIMSVPAEKLGLDRGGSVEVINVKCDPLLKGSALDRDYILPAYHMNKKSWVSVLLEGAEDELLKELIRYSFGSVSKKKKGRR